MFKRVLGTVCKQTKNTQLLNKTLATIKPTFNFSSVEKIQIAQEKLFKAVEREYNFEIENFQKDDSIEEFLKERNFKLIDEEGSIFLELQTTQNNTKITISFQSRSPSDQEGEGEEEIQQQQQEEEEPFQDYCDFTVYIQQGSENSGLSYECSSYDSEINVHAVNLVQDIEAHKKLNRFERISSDYTGPDFATLDERLQTSLVDYLKSVGIDEEVAAFVEHLSLDKEQRLYMRWLKDIKSYLQ